MRNGEHLTDRETALICLNCPLASCTGNCVRVHGPYEPRKRPYVRCVETGELYPSASEAARCLGRSATSLRAHLEGRYKHCGGLHFEYVMPKGEPAHA